MHPEDIGFKDCRVQHQLAYNTANVLCVEVAVSMATTFKVIKLLTCYLNDLYQPFMCVGVVRRHPCCSVLWVESTSG